MSFSEYLDEELGEHRNIHVEKIYHCPFCDDNRAFKLYVKVSNDNTDGLWHCKKCDRSGNPVKFIMEYNHYTFAEAKDLLSLYDYEITNIEQQAKDMGLSIEEQLLLFMGTLKKQEEIVETKLVPPPLPVGYRNDWTHADAFPFLAYLANKRGLSWADIRTHNMGFITNGYTLNATGKQVTLNNHVVILTHDEQGNYQYWNTRSIEPDAYIKTFNCPAKDNEYSKRTTVFNLNLARHEPNLFLTEGVFDALTLGTGGIATFGKQVTLNNHVVILTHDEQGNYQYWNTRSIEPDPYIKTFNCPAKDNEYSKRTTVFNLNLARHEPNLFLTEGVFDALTLGTGGIATFGKQVTQEQIDLILGSITPEQNLYIMLDMDAKEQMASLAKKLYSKHSNTYIVINPTGKDANDLGREKAYDIIQTNSVLADSRGQMLVLLG